MKHGGCLIGASTRRRTGRGSFRYLAYVDFDLPSAVAAYPDSFWINTEDYRKIIAVNRSPEGDIFQISKT